MLAEETTAEDVKVFVGGVDVTRGFKVEVDGTTATVVLKEPKQKGTVPICGVVFCGESANYAQLSRRW